jgi:hypothetical protein
MLEFVLPFLVVIGLILTPFIASLTVFLKIIKKKQCSRYKKPQTKLEEIFGYFGN